MQGSLGILESSMHLKNSIYSNNYGVYPTKFENMLRLHILYFLLSNKYA